MGCPGNFDNQFDHHMSIPTKSSTSCFVFCVFGFWEWGFGQLFSRVGGLGFMVLGLEFSVQRLELRLQGSGIRVWDLGCKGPGSRATGATSDSPTFAPVGEGGRLAGRQGFSVGWPVSGLAMYRPASGQAREADRPGNGLGGIWSRVKKSRVGAEVEREAWPLMRPTSGMAQDRPYTSDSWTLTPLNPARERSRARESERERERSRERESERERQANAGMARDGPASGMAQDRRASPERPPIPPTLTPTLLNSPKPSTPIP